MSNENERGGLRRPGRPNEKISYSGKCDVRLSAEENNMLDKLSRDNNVTRSDVMRRALKDYFRFVTGEED